MDLTSDPNDKVCFDRLLCLSLILKNCILQTLETAYADLEMRLINLLGKTMPPKIMLAEGRLVQDVSDELAEFCAGSLNLEPEESGQVRPKAKTPSQRATARTKSNIKEVETNLVSVQVKNAQFYPKVISAQ